MRAAVLALALFVAPPPTLADVTGHLELGYQEVRIDGDRSKYRQQLDLRDGFRVAGLAVHWHDPQANGWAPARLEVDAMGQGESPDSSLTLAMSGQSLWHLRLQRRRSDYLYQDLIRRPEDSSEQRADGGDFRHVDVERTHDRARLVLDPRADLQLTVDWDQLSRDGDSTTVLDVSREEFELDQPVDQRHRRAGLGLRYRWRSATLSMARHWRRDRDDGRILLTAPSAGGAGLTSLDSFLLSQPHQLRGSEQHIGLHLQPPGPWRAGLDLITTDVDVDVAAREQATGTNFQGVPLLVDQEFQVAADLDTRLVRGRVGYRVNPWLDLHAELHDRELDQDASVLTTPAGTVTGYRVEHRGGELGASLDPLPGLHLAAAWHSARRRSRNLVAGAQGNDEHTEVTRQDGYRLYLRWQPEQRLSLDLLAEDTAVDDPFTQTSATDVQRLRLGLRLRWQSGLYLTGSLRREERRNGLSGWQADLRQAQLRLGLRTTRLDVSAGLVHMDWSRDIDQLVTTPARRDLFAIRYDAESILADVSLAWQLTPQLAFEASSGRHDNDGSVPVDRRDSRLGLGLQLDDRWRLGLGWRRLDHSEESLEQFDADLFELRLRRDW